MKLAKRTRDLMKGSYMLGSGCLIAASAIAYGFLGGIIAVGIWLLVYGALAPILAPEEYE